LACRSLPAQTGTPVPELDPVQRRIAAIVDKYRLPGASFALTRQGKLVYARSFGYADREHRTAVEPGSLFRIGSISKPLTALSLVRLQEQGKLSLDTPVFDILREYQPLLGDPRMRRITVRQLLQHTAGWNPRASGDPLFPTHADIVAAGGSFPPTANDLIRVWIRRPLDFDPGTAFAYSNFGYLLAGRVIEQVSGQSYVEAVRTLLLVPEGISRMRLGRTLAAKSAPTEVAYYDVYSRSGTSIFSAAPQTVPLPYGTFSLELADSAGGWLASAIDLVRLLTAVDGSRRQALQAASFQQFVARPGGLEQSQTWYGLGINVAADNGGYNLVHDGGIPGTHALFGSLASGYAFAFITNTNPGDTNAVAFDNDLAMAVLDGIAAVRQWPAGDQFAEVYPTVALGLEVKGVASGASFAAGPVSPGELVSLFGTGLGPDTGHGSRVEGDRIATDLAGVKVYFNGWKAPMLYAQDGQVNVVAPFELADADEAAVTVEYGGVWTAPLVVRVVRARPALFQRGELAAAINQDGTPHATANPATTGSVVALYATGLGAPALPLADGQIVRAAVPHSPDLPSVTIGGRPARVEYCGAAPGLVAGVWQINVRVPADAPAGQVPVEVTWAGATTRALLAIR
jgi:uncharacterized protein (TIGR03437 family)